MTVQLGLYVLLLSQNVPLDEIFSVLMKMPSISRLLILTLFLIISLVPIVSFAGDKAGRAKVGLVLAGGGAKGGAHVGVLRMLEKWQIPVDYIAGTSMGAVVGGLYAAGKSPDEIEREILGIDWENLFVDSPDREDKSFRRKTDDRLYFFKAKPGFSDGELKVPRAYIQGQKFDLELKRILQDAKLADDFDRLSIPFRAVAADLESGAEVVLGKGNLVRAIRASMAVPGAFEPVEIDGRLLVDGGIVNNIPVNVVRQMGADILIVSDLGSDLLGREQINSGIDVAAQMVNFLFGLNSQKSLASLTDRDILISNQLGDIGSAGFDKIAETVAIGEQATRPHEHELASLSLSKAGWLAYQQARTGYRQAVPATIDFIEIKNNSDISDAVIAGAMSLKAGDRFDHKQLEADIQQIYGLDIFQSVRYELVERQGQSGIEVIAEEKTWGPDYLQAGVITSTDLEGQAAFRIGVAYTKTQLNELNGEFRIGLQLGDEPALIGELYQPLDYEGRYFTNIIGGYLSSNFYLYDSAGNNISEMYVGGPVVDLGIGRQFGNWGQIKLGYRRQHGETELVTGQQVSNGNFDVGEAYLRLSDDKFDSLYFPTQGHAGFLKWTVSDDSLGADEDFQQLDASYNQAIRFGKNTLIAGASLFSTIEGDAPFQSLYRLGGFGNLSGFEKDELSGQHAAIARGIYMHKIVNSMFFESYAGVTVEAGNVWQDKDSIDWDNNIVAGSLFIGADTPIGPAYLSYGRNDQDRESIYLIIGPPFSF
jgi:NTE family protein